MKWQEIRDLRTRRGLTQSELAGLVGVSQGRISQIENKGINTDSQLLLSIEEILEPPTQMSVEESIRPASGPSVENRPVTSAWPPSAIRLRFPETSRTERSERTGDWLRCEQWTRCAGRARDGREGGDFVYSRQFDERTCLLVFCDLAGHGPAMAPQQWYVRGWLDAWAGRTEAVPRIETLATDLSRSMRKGEISGAALLVLISRHKGKAVVEYESACCGFPLPLLLVGSPSRTKSAAEMSPPLPLRGPPVVLRHERLSPPWRLVVASDGLLSRLDADEGIARQKLRRWQEGPDRDISPADYFDTEDLALDDELFALVAWNAWDEEAWFHCLDLDERDRFAELVRHRLQGIVHDPVVDNMISAFREVIANVVKYAYPGEGGVVGARFREEPTGYRIEVEDHGQKELTDRDVRDSTGGLAFVKTVLKIADIRRAQEGGNIVEIYLERPGSIRRRKGR